MKSHSRVASWKDYRRRVLWFFGAWLVGFAVAAALAVALSFTSVGDWAGLALGAAWLAAFVASGIYLQLFRCPRCHEQFFSRRWFYWPFARKCVHAAKVAGLVCAWAGLRPNNSFKPKPLRSGKNMAEKACHVFTSTTRFGLTQALGGYDMTRWSKESSKPFGWACLVFAPLLFVMAAISTVESLTVYYVQLAVFSAASVATLVCGLAAIAGASWTSRGWLVVCYMACIYFLGSGVLLALFALKGLLQFGNSPLVLPLLVAAAISSVGLCFWGIARKVGG